MTETEVADEVVDQVDGTDVDDKDEPRPGADDKPTNNRAAPRAEYCTTILVAPYDGETKPAEDEYSEAQALDLSPTGLAFLLDHEPEEKDLVFRLGTEETNLVFVSARVAAVFEVLEGNKTQFRVGCEFTGRL